MANTNPFEGMDQNQILAAFAALQTQLQAAKDAEEVAKLQAERIRKESEEPISFAVGNKGGVVIRGLNGRGFPVTLFKESVAKVNEEFVARLHRFATEQDDRLKNRGESLHDYRVRIGMTAQDISDLETAEAKAAAKAKG